MCSKKPHHKCQLLSVRVSVEISLHKTTSCKRLDHHLESDLFPHKHASFFQALLPLVLCGVSVLIPCTPHDRKLIVNIVMKVN